MWGDAYPCKKYLMRPPYTQCVGTMHKVGKRARRIDGVLWVRFKCDGCGRQAMDTKVEQ